MLARWMLVLAVVDAGCIDAGLSRCASGRVCSPGLVCNDELDQCVGAIPASCGDGAIAVEEECDDGNRLSHDGCSSQCRLETPTWTRVAEHLAGAQRTDHALAYDPLRDRVVLFGGLAPGYVPQADTREWDGAAWVRPDSIGIEPMPRQNTAMTYDPIGHRVLLFGGINDVNHLGDTWGWNGAAWSQLSPATVPQARSYHGMATDTARSRVMMFGGTYMGATSNQQTDELWEWDGSTWMLATPAGLGPSPRMWAPLAYDARRERTVTFGGGDSDPPFINDTWEWDGTTWLAGQHGPSPRLGEGLSYDAGGFAIVWGGGDLNAAADPATWRWDGIAWVSSEIPSPAARSKHAIVYDALHRYVLLVGGENLPLWDDTWTFRYERADEPDESCIAGQDTDGDGLAGCADPDCWAHCTPMCPPGATCDPGAPRCGDGICNMDLELEVCPDDC